MKWIRHGALSITRPSSTYSHRGGQRQSVHGHRHIDLCQPRRRPDCSDGQAHGTFTAARGRPSASTAKASRVAGTLRNAAFPAKVAGPLTSVPKGRSLSALHHHYCASRDSAPTQPARHPNRPVDRCPVLGNAEAGVAISRRSNGNGGHRSSGHRSPTVCPDIFGERCPGPRRPARDWGSDCLPRCERSWGQGPVELRTCR
jgi:hypothetical protein